jgi:flagellar FliJ protein
MAYHYKLETLLSVRRNFEEQCMQKLAHEVYVLENHRKYLGELRKQRLDLVADLTDYKRGAMQAAMLSFYVDSIDQKDRQIGMQLNAIGAQENAVTEVRLELLEKVKARKIVERLKEKDFIAYTQDELRKTQNEDDEQAVIRFSQKKF